MRSETDEFECESGDKVKAMIASFNDNAVLFDCAYPMMTKKEAREFARQLLEMCGDEND